MIVSYKKIFIKILKLLEKNLKKRQRKESEQFLICEGFEPSEILIILIIFLIFFFKMLLKMLLNQQLNLISHTLNSWQLKGKN